MARLGRGGWWAPGAGLTWCTGASVLSCPPRYCAGIQPASGPTGADAAGNAVSRPDGDGRRAGAWLAEWTAANDTGSSAGRTECCQGQRGGRESVGEPEERDVPPDLLRHPRRGEGCVHRLDGGVLQPAGAPLTHRMWTPRGRYGGVRAEDGAL